MLELPKVEVAADQVCRRRKMQFISRTSTFVTKDEEPADERHSRALPQNGARNEFYRAASARRSGLAGELQVDLGAWLGCASTTNRDRIKVAGDSARLRCKPSWKHCR
jgi:hypothetical protein